jgi:hypothetical protein
MTQSRNRNVAFVSIAVVALAAGGAAYAASKSRAAAPAASSALTLGKVFASSTGSGHRFGGGHPGGPGRGGDELAAASSYLGIAQADLLTQLQAGKTLAQVADATSGKSAAGLIDALVAAEKTELDAAVKANSITQAQEDQIVPTLKARFTALVNGTRPSGAPPFAGVPHSDHRI